MVGNSFLKIRPNSEKADVDALAPDPSLHGVPNQTQEDSVEDDELASVQAPRVSVGNRKAEMVVCARD